MIEPEPFWRWWANMLPVRVCTADTLTPILTDSARLPLNTKRGFRGLDLLRAEIKSGRPGVILRR
jgi:hypothetical protein